MANSVAEPMARQRTDVERMVDAGVQSPSGFPAPPLPGDERGRREARAYGAALVPVFRSHTWEDMQELARNGWASRHAQVGDARYDWRLSWPAVREGWEAAGGTFAPPATDQGAQPTASEQIPSPPAIGAYVFDAFGEPAGRVKAVRDRDFLLDRPWARDVYVPFSVIRWPSPGSLGLAVSKAQLGAMGWERPKLLGLFGG
jgi:hypothetical protein